MATVDPIRVQGLRDLQAALRALDGESQKKLRLVLNDAAELVVRDAQRDIPVKSGRMRRTVRVQSSQREARVRAYGARAPYGPWVDFGGATGRHPNRAHRRPFFPDGRYLYPAYFENQDEILKLLVDGLNDLIRESGLDAT